MDDCVRLWVLLCWYVAIYFYYKSWASLDRICGSWSARVGEAEKPFFESQ